MNRHLEASIPLPTPLPTTLHDGTEFTAVRVVYRVTMHENTPLHRTVVFGAKDLENNTHLGWFDLPDHIPDAPQWLVDAAEAWAEQVTS